MVERWATVIDIVPDQQLKDLKGFYRPVALLLLDSHPTHAFVFPLWQAKRRRQMALDIFQEWTLTHRKRDPEPGSRQGTHTPGPSPC